MQNEAGTEIEQEELTQGEGENNEALETAQEGQTEGEEGEELPYELPDGTRVKTQAEAFAKMKQIVAQKDIDLAVADAYQRGIVETVQRGGISQNVTQAPVQTQEDDTAWESEFYANPKATIQKVRQETAAEVEARIMQRLSTRDEETQIWNTFTQNYPELADFKTDVEAIAGQHAEVVRALAASKGQKAAMDYVARKTKEKFDKYVENLKPRKELPRTATSQVPIGKGSGRVTQEKSETGPVDFITQFRKLKASRRR